MNILKNKWFYINSFIIYVVFSLVAFILSSIYLEPNVKSFFISSFMANKVGNPEIVEIVVDESNPDYPYPLPLHMYTEILDYFTTYAKPRVIGLDIFLPEHNPMRKADVDFVNQLNKMDNLVVSFLPSSENLTEKDISLMKEFKGKHALDVKKSVISYPGVYNQIFDVNPVYYDNAKNFASVRIERDGITDKVFAASNIVKIGDAYYPSLPLKMYLYENNTNEVEINDFYIYVPKTGLKIPNKLITNGVVQSDIRFYMNRIIKVGDKYIDTHSAHNNLPAYKIIESYRKLKAGKISELEFSPEEFNNKVVFIGINVNGASADVFKTPIYNRHPGVDIQATTYGNIAGNYFLRNVNIFAQFLLTFILSLMTFIIVLRCRFIKSLLLVSFIDIAYFILVALCAYSGYLMSFINPIVIQFVTLIFGYSYKFIAENRNKEKIKQAMGKYLSQDVMKNVVSNIDDLKLGGKRAVVTVLFSDIRGFTSMSEKMSAEDVSMILNEYFTEMEPIITKYNGVINKFIGDAVMAIFGEPIQDINHPQNAVKCAYEMLKKVEYLREKWLYEGKPKIEIGVGINTGEVFIGNIGSETRMEYTVIGDTVNLASRIESYNKDYKTNLLVSSSTYEAIADIADVIKISEVQIRGKAKKMNIYEVLRIDLKK